MGVEGQPRESLKGGGLSCVAATLVLEQRIRHDAVKNEETK